MDLSSSRPHSPLSSLSIGRQEQVRHDPCSSLVASGSRTGAQPMEGIADLSLPGASSEPFDQAAFVSLPSSSSLTPTTAVPRRPSASFTRSESAGGSSQPYQGFQSSSSERPRSHSFAGAMNAGVVDARELMGPPRAPPAPQRVGGPEEYDTLLAKYNRLKRKYFEGVKAREELSASLEKAERTIARLRQQKNSLLDHFHQTSAERPSDLESLSEISDQPHSEIELSSYASSVSPHDGSFNRRSFSSLQGKSSTKRGHTSDDDGEREEILTDTDQDPLGRRSFSEQGSPASSVRGESKRLRHSRSPSPASSGRTSGEWQYTMSLSRQGSASSRLSSRRSTLERPPPASGLSPGVGIGRLALDDHSSQHGSVTSERTPVAGHFASAATTSVSRRHSESSDSSPPISPLLPEQSLPSSGAASAADTSSSPALSAPTPLPLPAPHPSSSLPTILSTVDKPARTTKPKRLKAHNVVSKHIQIPQVPRRPDGNVTLPLQIGIITLHKLGEVTDREHFHTERYIFPIGYEVTRMYNSMINADVQVMYTCRIIDGGDGPRFEIIPADQPDKPIVAGTATGAWSGIVRTANAIRNRQHSNSVSGPDYYGLGQNSVKNLLQGLPGVRKLKDYVWQHYWEGGLLGGRHASVYALDLGENAATVAARAVDSSAALPSAAKMSGRANLKTAIAASAAAAVSASSVKDASPSTSTSTSASTGAAGSAWVDRRMSETSSVTASTSGGGPLSASQAYLPTSRQFERYRPSLPSLQHEVSPTDAAARDPRRYSFPRETARDRHVVLPPIDSAAAAAAVPSSSPGWARAQPFAYSKQPPPPPGYYASAAGGLPTGSMAGYVYTPSPGTTSFPSPSTATYPGGPEYGQPGHDQQQQQQQHSSYPSHHHRHSSSSQLQERPVQPSRPPPIPMHPPPPHGGGPPPPALAWRGGAEPIHPAYLGRESSTSSAGVGAGGGGGGPWAMSFTSPRGPPPLAAPITGGGVPPPLGAPPPPPPPPPPPRGAGDNRPPVWADRTLPPLEPRPVSGYGPAMRRTPSSTAPLTDVITRSRSPHGPGPSGGGRAEEEVEEVEMLSESRDRWKRFW